MVQSYNIYTDTPNIFATFFKNFLRVFFTRSNTRARVRARTYIYDTLFLASSQSYNQASQTAAKLQRKNFFATFLPNYLVVWL